MSDGPTGYLCYAEADEVLVQRLRRRLQAFSIPAALRTGGRGRLGRFTAEARVARNEESLIQELATAEWLIVCCSPASFASERVNAEIDTFIRLNANARIVMVLLHGDPREALAPRLRAREPVTADFRPDADGDELGFLKLAAALAGVNLGALRDRQAAGERARGRANAALIAGFALLAGAGAAASIAAMDERDRAAAMARAAVDIGADLAGEADDPSRSEERFQRLFAEGVRNSEFARQRAHLLVQFAEFYRNQGDADKSRERALAAITAFEALGEAERGAPDFARALALMSQMEAEAGRDGEAIAYGERAVEAARAAPDRSAFADALLHLGQLHLRAGRPADAAPLFTEALVPLEAAVAAMANDEAAAAKLIAALDWLGEAQTGAANWAGARESFSRSAELTRARLARTPGDNAARAALGATLMKLGQALVAAGENQAARAPLEESLVLARAEAAANAGDLESARRLSARLILAARVQARLGAASGEVLDEAISAARAQTLTDRADTQAKPTLAELLNANAARLRRAGDFAGARAGWRDGAQVLREARAATPADAAGLSSALAETLENQGEASTRLNDAPGALAAYGEAVRARRAALAVAPADKSYRAALAQTLHTLGLLRTRADNDAAARAAFDEAARLRVALAEEDPSDAAMAGLAVDSLQRLAQAHQANENAEGARRALERARDILARLAEADPADTRRAAALRRAEAAMRAAGVSD